jgi:hypothetical protein
MAEAEEDEDTTTKLRDVVKENEERWKRVKEEAGLPSAEDRKKQLAEAEEKRKQAAEPYRKSLQTIDAMQDDILANLPALRTPEPPKYQDVKPRPDIKRGNPMLAFQNAGTIFALAASGLSRRPLTAAFSAAAGALEGYQEGDNERVKGELDRWKQENDNIKDQNDIETKRFNAIVSATNLTHNEMVQRISLLNSITRNKTAQYALETGGIEAAEQVYQQSSKYALDLYKAFETADNHLRDDIAKQEENKLKREQQRHLQTERLQARQKEQEAKKKEATWGTYKGTQGQNQSLLYAEMLEEGAEQMAKALDAGYVPTELDSLINEFLADPSRNTNPGVLARIAGKAGNRALTKDAQEFFNGARKVQAAILRSETGKAFGAGEIRDVAQRYVVQPGEKLREQKFSSLDQYRQALYGGSGLPMQAWDRENANRVRSGLAPIPLPPPEMVAQAQEAIRGGASRTEVLQIIRNQGYRVPPGL